MAEGSVNVGAVTRASRDSTLADLGVASDPAVVSAAIAGLIETHTNLRAQKKPLLGEEDAQQKKNLNRGELGTTAFVRDRVAALAAAIQAERKKASEQAAAVRADRRLSALGQKDALETIEAELQEAQQKILAEYAARVEDLAGAYEATLTAQLAEQLAARTVMPAEERRHEAQFFLSATAGLSPEALVKAFCEFALPEDWAAEALRGVAVRLAGDATGDAWATLRAAIRRAKVARASAFATATDPSSKAIRTTALKLALLHEAVTGFKRAHQFVLAHPGDADLTIPVVFEEVE